MFDLNDSRRASGRTTRMLCAAAAQVMAGHTVTIVVHNNEHIRVLENMVRHWFTHSMVTNMRFKVYDATTTPAPTDAFYKHDNTFYDHHVFYEVLRRANLAYKEYTRYDLKPE